MGAPPIELTMTVARSPDPVSGDLDGSVVLLSVQNGQYYGMNAVGSRVWEFLAEPLVVAVLVDHLLDEYDVERGECENTVLAFLERLRADNLVQVRRP